MEPIAGGPFRPPGRFDAVEPRSVSFASAVRLLVEDELPELLFGVEKRLRAVESEDPDPPPAAALDAVLEEEEVPEAGAAEDDEEDDDELACPELEEEDDEEVEEDELPEEEAWNVGLLEIALTLAREEEGIPALGLPRRPRNCGTTMAA